MTDSTRDKFSAESRYLPVEFKFDSESEPGVFHGLGAVFGNTDSHGDVIAPGAFSKSLTAHKAAGTMPLMYVEHSFNQLGGDPLPVGKWLDMHEDNVGLRVKGKLSALDTDHGKRIRSLMRDGALPGMSIAFTIPAGGSVRGKTPGDPARTLREVKLHAVDIVTRPSNPKALVHSVKTDPVRFQSKAQLVDWMHEAGVSIMAAQKIASGGWPAISQLDDDENDVQSLIEAMRDARHELSNIQLR